MSTILCPTCGGSLLETTAADGKVTCTTCGGSGSIESSDPADKFKEVVWQNGEPVQQDIDPAG